jgi:hypothetical protein
VKKIAQSVAQTFFIDKKSNIMCSGKSTQIGLFLYFFSKLPKVNDRPMGENSPNLVTLLGMLNNLGRWPSHQPYQKKIVFLLSSCQFNARTGLA